MGLVIKSSHYRLYRSVSQNQIPGVPGNHQFFVGLHDPNGVGLSFLEMIGAFFLFQSESK